MACDLGVKNLNCPALMKAPAQLETHVKAADFFSVAFRVCGDELI
jgi:hypothetical protein